MSKKIETIVNNKKAYFNYEIGETFVAGLRILGTEIKSVREGSCSIKESFCIINDGEIYVKNMYIKEYKFGEKHDETRERKLLLTKQEIKKITKK
jgi:SsrA-binding protein